MFFDPSGLYTVGFPLLNGYGIQVHNVQEYETGIYCDLRDIAGLSGAGITWDTYDNKAVTTLIFNKNDNRYEIKIYFDNVKDGEYSSNIAVYKNGEIVGNEDPVKSSLNNQNAQFFLKTDENGNGLKVQAKMSTMFWIFEKDTMYQWFLAAYQAASMYEKYYGIDKQIILDEIKETAQFKTDLSGKAPSYDDIFAKLLKP